MQKLFRRVLIAGILISGSMSAYGQETPPASADSSLPAAAEENVTGVATEPVYLKTLFLHQWVTTSAQGELTGDVVSLTIGGQIPLRGVRVSLVGDSGEVKTADTDANGKFALKGVEPGRYTLSGTGGKTFFAYPIVVADNSSLPSDIHAYAIDPNGDVAAKYLFQFSSPAWTYGPSVSSTEPLQHDRSFDAVPQIALNEQGQLTGAIGSSGKDSSGVDYSSQSIFILQGDREVAKTRVSSDGTYVIPDLEPGVYGFVSAGKLGFAAVAFELVANQSETTQANGNALPKFKLVAAKLQAGSSLNMEISPVPEPEILFSQQNSSNDQSSGTPVPGGGGVSGGGAGGGGGGGGAGGIGAAAGLAGAAGALAGSNGSNNSNSPSTPQ